ncbi:MAG TPA: fibronectin type III domain-containing protein [Candidatus Paceibacterota bacterium]|nr:fibronectin type III domain-containing protein [Candidatus Paceibacterota bacterium]
MLRLLSAYVEDIAKGDATVIELSGFQPVQRGPSPQQPLVKTIIQAIIIEVSGQLLARLNPQGNAYGYEGQMSADGGKTWQSIGFFQQARRVVIPNLTPGVIYTFKFRALGGSTGSGDWSDPVSHMAT